MRFHRMNDSTSRAGRCGFTLVELAVVMVVIALIVGGILEGQSLMQQQRLRNVLQDAKTYAIAIQQFSDKYGALPGDMSDAVRLWGRADGVANIAANCAQPNTTRSVGSPTCNGDGNGLIQKFNTAGVDESFRAWQQLVAAGIVPGKFCGISSNTASCIIGGVAPVGIVALPGVNVPQAAIGSGGYFLDSLGTQSGAATLFDGDYNNSMLLGAAVVNGIPNGTILTPQEAQAMDQKADDGLPGQGSMMARKPTVSPNTNQCVSTNSAQTAVYNAGLSTRLCYFYFLKTFQANPQHQ